MQRLSGIYSGRGNLMVEIVVVWHRDGGKWNNWNEDGVVGGSDWKK